MDSYNLTCAEIGRRDLCYTVNAKIACPYSCGMACPGCQVPTTSLEVPGFWECVIADVTRSSVNLSGVKGIMINQLGAQIHEVPSWIGELPEAIGLTLSHGYLTSLQVGLFRNDTELQFIDLSVNRLTQLEVDVFSTNIRLEALDLSHNEFTSFEAVRSPFSSLVKLNTLRLGSNRLTTLEADLFIANVRLEVLDLTGNLISDLGGCPFQHLSVSILFLFTPVFVCQETRLWTISD